MASESALMQLQAVYADERGDDDEDEEDEENENGCAVGGVGEEEDGAPRSGDGGDGAAAAAGPSSSPSAAGARKRTRDDEGDGGARPDATILCEVCHERSPKYTCPACLTRTCSLECVREHKRRTSCDGKRDRTKFVPVSSMTDAHLRSDYVLLEDTLRQCESSRRAEPPGRPGSKLPVRLSMLVQAAAGRMRGTRLMIMPQGAQRRRENTTTLHKKKKQILWRVEWYFAKVDLTHAEDRVHEDSLLGEHLESMLKNLTANTTASASVQRHRLRAYRENPDQLRIVMKLERRPANAPTFVRLDPKVSLRESLSGHTIIEFPRFIVVVGDEALEREYGIVDGAPQPSRWGVNGTAAEAISGVPSVSEEEREAGPPEELPMERGPREADGCVEA